MSDCEADTGNNVGFSRFFKRRLPKPKASSNKTEDGVVSVTSDRYNIDYLSMGTCIIISNENFQGASCLNGNAVDAAAAAETFTRLGYKVKVEKDQTAAQMRDLLYNVSREDHSRSASFVCVMLSYGGDEGKIYGTDGMDCNDNHMELKELMGMFRGEPCRSLVGKPKLFFIEACRGSNVDDGIVTDCDETDVRSDQSEEFRIPVEADFLYAYSPGYASRETSDAGSWFLQSLCKTLNAHAAVLPLKQMLTRVNRKVALDSDTSNQHYKKKRQMPSVVSMLTKELYFPAVTGPVAWPPRQGCVNVKLGPWHRPTFSPPPTPPLARAKKHGFCYVPVQKTGPVPRV